MDPFSVTAGVVGIADSVTKLSCAISRFRHDYKCADEDLDIAWQHALLLKEEIRALDAKKACYFTSPHKTKLRNPSPDAATEKGHVVMEEASFAKAMSTAHALLSAIEQSFPLHSEPHTWKTKVRWALKDKRVLADLKDRLKSAESTLQGIASMEQLLVLHYIEPLSSIYAHG
jgi:hypothetical protein